MFRLVSTICVHRLAALHIIQGTSQGDIMAITWPMPLTLLGCLEAGLPSPCIRVLGLSSLVGKTSVSTRNNTDIPTTYHPPPHALPCPPMPPHATPTNPHPHLRHSPRSFGPKLSPKARSNCSKGTTSPLLEASCTRCWLMHRPRGLRGSSRRAKERGAARIGCGADAPDTPRRKRTEARDGHLRRGSQEPPKSLDPCD